MTRAMWNNAVIAESDDVVVVDGYHYFPADSVDATLLVPSDHTSVCGWKGTARYFTIVVDGSENRDAAWHYPTPSRAAARVADRIAFWHGVKIVKDPGGTPGLLTRLRNRLGRRAGHGAVAAVDSEDSSTPSAPVIDLSDETFEAATEGGWTIVDFWAPWCGPCRAFHPVFDTLARAHAHEVRFARCDVDRCPKSAAALGISSIPTVVLFDPEGNEVDRVVGVPAQRDLVRLVAHTSSAPASVPSAPA